MTAVYLVPNPTAQWFGSGLAKRFSCSGLDSAGELQAGWVGGGLLGAGRGFC